MFDCACNTQNSLLLNQHNGDDVPQDLEIHSYISIVVFCLWTEEELKNTGLEGWERKWLAKRMNDAEGEIKGIVESQTVGPWGRMSQYLACPQASSHTDVLLVYTATSQKNSTQLQKFFFFYICTVHPAIIKVLLPTDAQENCFQRSIKIYIKIKIAPTSYVYWTVHHCDSWRIRDQLDVTSY